MSLENPGTPKALKTPDTSEEMITKYMSYPDVGTPTEIMNRAENTLGRDSAKKYADALMELADREGMQKVLELAGKMKEAMKADAGILELKISDFGKDRSWAMWDLGKQFYLYKNNGETSDEYRDNLADPMDDNFESDEKKREIVNRHLGWEAYKAYRNNIGGKWKDKVDAHPDEFALAMDLLQKSPEKPDGQLHSYEYAELGKRLHTIAGNLQQQKDLEDEVRRAATATVPPQHETEPRLIDTGDMPGDLSAGGFSSNEPAAPEHSHNAEPIQETENSSTHNEHIESSQKTLTTNKRIERKGGVTPGRVLKATGLAAVLLPAVTAWFVGKEFVKTAWQSVTNMFGVLKNWVKSGFSFKFLNKSPDATATKGGSHDAAHSASKADHGGDHGAGDHGGDHGGGKKKAEAAHH